MKKLLITTAMLTSISFSGLAMAADAMEIQNEIKDYEKSRADAQAEIDQLKVKLEKATDAVNQNETKVQEIQAKLDAAK
jgi:peptidoglycan hydrolase CwlO-like protein